MRRVEVLDLEASVAEGQSSDLMVVPRVAGSEVVLKVIELGSTSAEALERARREVLLLQRIENTHVVRVLSDLVVLGAGPSGAAWLEELLPGHDLVDEVGLAWEESRAMQLMRQVSLGLAEMHNERVIHRDLSPRNVRIATSDRFVVMDPGYARHELLPAITVGGQPGTPGFMSPEHLLPPPNGPTPFSDVFCVGILGYLALTGETPIPYDGDGTGYAARLRSVEHTPLNVRRLGLSELVVTVVARCLHPQPARRFRNAGEIAVALMEGSDD